jgi:hypothetical protein
MNRLRLIPNKNSRLFEELLADMFIDPLENELGFEFIGYNSLSEGKGGNGVHVLMFNEKINGKMDIEGPEFERLKEICQQDDDGQPYSTFRLWLGHLWVMVPFVL